MKKQWLIPLALLTAAAAAASVHAAFAEEEDLCNIRFDVNHIYTKWNPDGTWSPDEYTEIPVQASWISAVTADDANLDAAKNLDFTLGMSWDEEYVYTFVQHEDQNGYSSPYDTDPGSMWYESCMQVCYTDADQIGDQRLEYGITRSSDTGNLLANVWADYLGIGYVPTDSDYTVVVDGNVVTYEFRTPFSAFSKLQTAQGNTYGLCYVISWGNEQDYIHTQLASGCSGYSGKNAGNFAQFTLMDSGSTGSDGIALKGISIAGWNPTRFSYLDIGKTYPLSVKFTPTYAANKTVQWTSSNPDVISVDDKGQITIHAVGFSNITVTAEDGGFTDSINVGVQYYLPEEAQNKVTFDVQGINTTWSPDGTWSENEYYEIPVDRSWVSAWAETEEDVQSAKDLDFTLAMSWDTDYVYTYIAYENANGHVNTYTEDAFGIWTQDCVQAAFTDVEEKNFDTLEYGMAHSSAADKLLKYVWADYLSSGFIPSEDDFICVANGNTLIYEFRTPFSAFSDMTPRNGKQYKTCFLLSRAIDTHTAHTQLASGCTDYCKDASNFATFTLKSGTAVQPTDPDYVPVTGVSISITPDTAYPYVGRSYRVIGHVRPSNASNQNVRFSSSNPDVISVDENGNLTIHKVGQANIYVTTEDGGYEAYMGRLACYDPKDSATFDIKYGNESWQPNGIWDIDEYTEIPWEKTWLSAYADNDADLASATGLDFRLGMAWDYNYIYTYISYENANGHKNTCSEDVSEILMQDAVQASFSDAENTGFDRLTYGIAHSTTTDKLLKYVYQDYRNSNFTPGTDDFICVVDGNKLVYEFRTPFSAFSSAYANYGMSYRISFLMSRATSNGYAQTQLASGKSGFTENTEDFAVVRLVDREADVTITSTPNKQTVRAGDTISYDLTMSGSYDGFSFIVRPPEGMSITAIEAGDAIGGQTINVDKFEDDYWMISILPGCSQVKSADTRIATVTLYVNEGITPGERTDIFPSWSESIVTNIKGNRVHSKRVLTQSYTVIKSIPGDVNGDGVLDYYDITKLYSCYRRQTVIDNELVKDINGDNTFNYLDIAKLYAMLREQTA